MVSIIKYGVPGIPELDSIFFGVRMKVKLKMPSYKQLSFLITSNKSAIYFYLTIRKLPVYNIVSP